MKTMQCYPVIMTSDVAQTATFYRTYLDLIVLFESDWYVHLQSRTNTSVNLAVLDANHASIPEKQRGAPTRGMLLNVEVEDVDSVYDKFVTCGVPILLSLQNEAWGQRHFIAEDPNGVMIDVITPIEPSAEYAAHYVDPVLS